MRFKMKVIVVASALMCSFGAALGAPSKRPVASGEVVPQEDAIMENGGVIGEGVASQGTEVIQARPVTVGGVWNKLDAHERHYAAVKLVHNGAQFKFAQGKSYLADGHHAILNALPKLKPDEVFIIVTYQDIVRSDADNEALAKARAESIKKALLDLKISSERVLMLKPVLGVGESDFALFADRVDLKVGNKDDGYTQSEVITP